KGGVGKSTSAALLAAEIAELRPGWMVLVEDLDPYRHLTERWPGDSSSLRLVDEGQGMGEARLIDTGPGDTPAFLQALERADYVVVTWCPCDPSQCQRKLWNASYRCCATSSRPATGRRGSLGSS